MNGIWDFKRKTDDFNDNIKFNRNIKNSESERYYFLFEGNIHNIAEIQNEFNVKGEIFSFLFNKLGISESCKKFNGSFLFSIWDKKEKKLHLVRDRVGKRVLYYGFNNDLFWFGSRLSDISGNHLFKPAISKSSMELYLKLNYIPAPYCIFEGMFKVLPGTIKTINSNLEIYEEKYWDILDVYLSNNLSNNLKNNDSKNSNLLKKEEYVEQLEFLLKDSVRKRMSINTGAFLSGGIDSTTVTAIAQSQSTKPIKTFCIGFNEQEYNEAENAKLISRYLGTDHHELYVTSNDAIDIIPEIPNIYDEPFADSSQIPTYFAFKLAKESVDFVLSGDGNDQLFLGGNRHLMGNKLCKIYKHTPVFLLKLLLNSILLLNSKHLDVLFALFPKKYRQPHKIYKAAELLLNKNSEFEIISSLTETWFNTDKLIGDDFERIKIYNEKLSTIFCQDANILKDLCINNLEIMSLLDIELYMKDDILTKVGKASRFCNINLNSPILDHNIIEYIFSIPQECRFYDNQTKWPLKQILYKYVPKEIMNRPKMGFSLPVGQWLRGPLRHWAEELLSEKSLANSGFEENKIIRKKWSSHLSGKKNWQHQLWNILMFQQWHQNLFQQR